VASFTRTDVVPDLSGMRVLLVEDNVVNQQIALELMRSAGVSVDLASNGYDAIKKIFEFGPKHYQCVLMDLQMPQMDGHEATAVIRSDNTFNCLPIIAMTAHAINEERARCLAEGMNEHITKPIDPALLYERLQYWHQHRLNADGSSRILNGTLSIEMQAEESFVVQEPAALVNGVAQLLNSDVDKLQRLAGVAGLDVKDGLARLGQNAGIYWLIIQQLALTEHDNVSRIRAALADNDLETACRTAHSLKGAAANLSVHELTRYATAAESILRQSDGGDELILLLEQMDTVMQDFCAAVQRIEAGAM
jgi:two-component system sensor histidine kinase/response regulator